MTIADARYCEQLTRRHARTFAVASYLLPAHKRRGTFALYAFCRIADDLVDSHDAMADRGRTRQGIEQLRRSLKGAIDGHGHDAVFRELAWAVRTFDVPAGPLYELVDGVAVDIARARWDTWDELREYSEGVAGCVGEMCASVMGIQGERQSAIRRARDLGVAMQLTNILRDVGEDAARGRVYLPADELAQYSFTADDVLDGAVLHHPSWRAFMRTQVVRAREWYDRAMPGIHHLAPDAQRCAWACAVGYSRILDVIERNGYDSFTQRASLGWGERALVLGKCLLSTPHTHAA